MPKPIKDFAAHFWERVDMSGGPDACWPWMGSRDRNGYGTTGLPRSKKSALAHRTAYRLTYGDIGDSWVLHTCDHPYCVNPAHLYLGNAADNARDMRVRSRNPRFRLADAIVLDIKRRINNGDTLTDIAKAHGVSRTAISNIRMGRFWRNVGPRIKPWKHSLKPIISLTVVAKTIGISKSGANLLCHKGKLSLKQEGDEVVVEAMTKYGPKTARIRPTKETASPGEKPNEAK